MAGDITPELFAHLVELAAFELPAGQAEYLRAELNKQLESIRELEAIRVGEAIPITSHGVPYLPAISSRPSADIIQPFPHPEEILAQAPESQEGYFVVPDIPHTEL
ncbi:MAG: Asp-tRNA(Asn)/Glu-tRNA(Gln) amidotransferase subunit GatC [Anaerolineales bacterium]|jgi:aspartyl/glutamyl-tRNA(Asn/Gln) amidotransferase C subunit